MATSRLCVKHLPKHVNEQELKAHFSGKWTITDAKLARTKEGASRQFGFLGFETPEDAAAARSYFDKSFLGASRLSIEFARSMSDNKSIRPWSRHSQGSSAHTKVHQLDPLPRTLKKKEKFSSGQKEVILTPEDNPKLKEFLQLMQPRSKVWGNDDDPPGGYVAAEIDKDREGDSSDELLTDLEDTKSSHDPDKMMDNANDRAVPSNMDYLKSRMTSTFSVEPSDAVRRTSEMDGSSSELEEVSSDEHLNNADSQDWTRVLDGDLGPEVHSKDSDGLQGESLERIHCANTLFVRNLPYTASETDLLHLFESFGDIIEVSLAKDRLERSKGFAIITFSKAEAASEALGQMDGYIFRGRLMHVLPGTTKKQSVTEPIENTGVPEVGFKAEREASRKANAGNRSAWNSLFMRPDTVAEAIAEHYGVQKRDLMDRDASDLGVRMALGETQVIMKTKADLRKSGVDVNLLEEGALAAGKASDSIAIARSSTVLLIKNLPFRTKETELLELFGNVGPVLRLVLPASKAIALVEYGASSDAIKAFRSLAYKNYHGVPVYLEWAPKGIFTILASQLDQPVAHTDTKGDTPQLEERILEGNSLEMEERDSEDESSRSTKCIFVKNLSFSTTESGLKNHFDKIVSEVGGALRSVVLATKLRRDGKRMSAGYGFVEVDSDAAVKHTIKSLQGSLLDGHKIDLQRSVPKSHGQQVAAIVTNSRKRRKEKQKSSKLLVRNLAFESTKKDLLGLFGPFGHIRTCRIPKKFDGTHRGFAFIDFVTKQEAESAKDGVCGAHLYGRRLVIEYAKDDDGGLEGLRAKTSNQFNEFGFTNGESVTKKMKS